MQNILQWTFLVRKTTLTQLEFFFRDGSLLSRFFQIGVSAVWDFDDFSNRNILDFRRIDFLG